MPVNTELAFKVWNRYAYCRDNGHQAFVEKADKCDAFFRGEQWDAGDLAKLRAGRRPALTINKIISTLSNIMGEQIFNRAEISFRPRSGSPAETAEALAKVFKQISDNNQLDWKRSDMFADGVITSRGFLDMRLDFDDQMQGEIKIENLNMKNVIVDPDAESYDPDQWNEVHISKWMTGNDISILYSKEDGKLLGDRAHSALPFGYDSIVDRLRDRFGNNLTPMYGGIYDETGVTRNIRVIERQYRKMDNQEHFVSVDGDMRPVPPEFTREKKAWFVQQFGFKIIKKMTNRIRWTTVADNVVLHDDWSPYKHFTVIPYFPLFRHGRTIGLVENLLGSQELLNKVSSQELHVVNTTANSGWVMRKGAVTNMSNEELEARGAETGIVIEVGGEGTLKEQLDKITPNQVPQGLDRITYKAEENMKSISGVSDSMQGQDRADVAAKAIQAKRQAGSTNLAKPLDSLVRTDFILARNALDIIQEFYSEERLITTTKDRVTGENETTSVNQAQTDPDTGVTQIVNDLTLGEYGVVISSVPQRETLEDSQFDQAMAMKEAGVQIPDEVLIENSRLINKKDVVAKMNAGKNSPEAQQAAQVQQEGLVAEVGKTHADTEDKIASAALKRAKAAKEGQPDAGDGGAGVAQAHATIAKTGADIGLQERKFQHEQTMDHAKLAEEQRGNQVQEQLDAELARNEAEATRAAAATAAANPTPTGATQ